jgi:dCTP diphosphatase
VPPPTAPTWGWIAPNSTNVPWVNEFEDLAARLRAFVAERDWDQFHTPKNLAMALAGESGELLAELQWLTDDEIRAGMAGTDLRERVSHEVADVLMYLIRFADVCGIDLVPAVLDKMELNGQRYPVKHSMGSVTKYDRR